MDLSARNVTTGQGVTFAADTQIGPDVTIGNHVTFYPGVTVGAGATILDGAVLGRPPLSAGNITRRVTSTPRPLTIGAGSIVGANCVLYTGTTIGERALIGDLTTIREGCALAADVVIGRGVLVMYDTTIGERSRVIDGAILTGDMTIEADVFIGPGANSINDDDVYLKRFGLVPAEWRGPVVRRFALIGAGANLAAGVEIGTGAIVAPSAMVTADVPAWTIVAGVPAQSRGAVPLEHRNLILRKFGLPPLEHE